MINTCAATTGIEETEPRLLVIKLADLHKNSNIDDVYENLAKTNPQHMRKDVVNVTQVYNGSSSSSFILTNLLLIITILVIRLLAMLLLLLLPLKTLTATIALSHFVSMNMVSHTTILLLLQLVLP